MDKILHQLIGSLSQYLQGFIHPRWLFGISEPSTEAEISLPPAFVQEVLYMLGGVFIRTSNEKTNVGV